MKNIFYLVLLLLVIKPEISYSQSGSTQEEAMQLYTEGKYPEALDKFKKLITLFPKDPKYYYYSGICMVKLNTTLDVAVKYLTYASELATPRDVYFYLGKALHYQYKFKEAEDAYQKFQQFGNPPDVEKLLCNMHLTMVRCGKSQYRYAKIVVLEKTPSDLGNSYVILNNNLKNGQFKQKTNKLIKLKDEISNSPWRYEPIGIQKDYFVFDNTNTVLKPNSDIVKVKKLDGTKWARPENLGTTINTSFDENYAYFNEAESALYFSSKGHCSIGGYDIFKAIYNPDYKTWSVPENLGYPINSPYDDFLFVPDDEQRFALFVSNRETSGTNLMVYKMRFEKNFSYANISAGFVYTNIVEVQKEVSVSPVAEVPAAVANTANASNQGVGSKTSSNSNINYPKELLQSADYNNTLNNALVFQLKSDSLGRLIEAQRELLNTTDNESEKTAGKMRIFQWDKQSRLYQLKADSLYVKAKNIEAKTLISNKDNSPVLTNNMAKDALKADKTESLKSNTSTRVDETKDNTKNTSNVVYEFKVMSKSPYNSVSEIPVNQPLPSGIIYRIQLGAFSKSIEPGRFKGIIPISGETVGNTTVTKYYAGLFNRMTDAEKALNKIKQYGFKDVFIVAFFNGKPIPSNRAVELEKQ